MHVLLIHQAFAMPGEAGGTRHYELAQHLVQKGHSVTIIASTVSYTTGHAPEASVDSRPEHLDGIDVQRAWVYSALHRSFFHRVLSFLSFMVSSFLCAMRVRHVDVVWGTSPPIFQALTAYVVAVLKRVPFVFEVRDLWPVFAVELGVLRNRSLIWASRRLERFLYRHAAKVMPNSPGFIPHLRRSGVPEHRTALVPNGVELSAFDPDYRGTEVRRTLELENHFVVLYAGAHGLANDLGTVLLAAKQLEPYPSISVLLLGDGKERSNLMRQADELGLTNVRFLPAQPKERMAAFLAAADVCIANLKPIPMFATVYPNKVFDYMAAGRPTLLAIDGVIREVIENADGGVYVPPGNPDAMAGTVLTYCEDRELCQRQGRAARTYVSEHFDRKTHASKLESIFQHVVGESKLKQRLPSDLHVCGARRTVDADQFVGQRNRDA